MHNFLFFFFIFFFFTAHKICIQRFPGPKMKADSSCCHLISDRNKKKQPSESHILLRTWIKSFLCRLIHERAICSWHFFNYFPCRCWYWYPMCCTPPCRKDRFFQILLWTVEITNWSSRFEGKCIRSFYHNLFSLFFGYKPGLLLGMMVFCPSLQLKQNLSWFFSCNLQGWGFCGFFFQCFQSSAFPADFCSF